jgi:hypothetical protein
MSYHPATAGDRGRRIATTVASLALVAGAGMSIGAPSAAAATTPSLTLALPSTIGNGGDLRAGSATIDNTGGSTITAARVDFDITPAGGTAALDPTDLVVKYELVPNSGQYQTIPLTADASGGGVHGYFGPQAGFPVLAGAVTTTNLQVATNPGAPTGGISVTADLDTTPGDTTSQIATDTKAITVATPTLTFAGFPTQLNRGDTTAFTGTLTNTTGSNYGGGAPSNSPTPAGVRLDFSIASSDSAVTTADLTLQYCLGANDEACTGGTWTTIPLTDTHGTFTGYFGPAGGFALPNTATNATPFRIEVGSGSPGTTLTSTVALDKVDSSGSTAGTDSSGVANGALVTANPGPTTIATADPTITAKVSSAHPKSTYGWYRSRVHIAFSCTEGSAPLTSPCPERKTLIANTTGRSVTRMITATDGGTATVTVAGINIDKTDPHVHVKGAERGHTYAHRRHLHARCNDHRSGVATCKVSSHRSGHKVTFHAVARDKAGNVAKTHGYYRIRGRKGASRK